MEQGLKPKRETRWKTGPGTDSNMFRQTVLAAVRDEWPTHPMRIVKKLNMPGNKSDLLLVKYHIDQLAKEGHIVIKKIDRTAVCWPRNIEEVRYK